VVGGLEAWLIVDDTALPKKASARSASRGNTPWPWARTPTATVGLRLFLLESRTSDPAPLTGAGAPEDLRLYRTELEIAVAEIDRVRAAGARFGCVLVPRPPRASTNSGHGIGRTGDAGEGAVADAELAARDEGCLQARCAARRVRIADGPPQRIGTMGAQHLPRGRSLVDRRTSLERRAHTISRTARRHFTHAPDRRDRGSLDLRPSASAVEGGTRPRPLRGTIIDN
jgi:hypothetical protein